MPGLSANCLLTSAGTIAVTPPGCGGSEQGSHCSRERPDQPHFGRAAACRIHENGRACVHDTTYAARVPSGPPPVDSEPEATRSGLCRALDTCEPEFVKRWMSVGCWLGLPFVYDGQRSRERRQPVCLSSSTRRWPMWCLLV